MVPMRFILAHPCTISTNPKNLFLAWTISRFRHGYTLHGGGYFPSESSGQTWYVSALYSSQATASELVFGGALELSASTDETKPVNVYIGAWTRLNNVSDALIPYVGLDYGSFNLGLTYDVNISNFKVATQTRGGMEISLIYIFKQTDGSAKEKVQCPHF